jgi:hypothetical protein
MKRQLTIDDQQTLIGSLNFLEDMWGVKTHYDIDTETGRGVVQVWLPGTNVVLHLESVDVRRIRVIDRNTQRFPDPAG